MKISENIRNIIFDLGGVILNIDYNLTAEAFKKLGVANFEEMYSQAEQSKFFDLFETGKITASEFREKIKGIINVPDEKIDAAWNSMLLDLPQQRISLLKTLRKKYRLFLLSNTNEIHIAWINDYLKKEFGLENFDPLFDKVYFSHKVGLRKPHKEIFDLLLNENNLKAEETLFIDDSFQHIEGAQKTGIQTLFLEKGKKITEVFKNFLT